MRLPSKNHLFFHVQLQGSAISKIKSHLSYKDKHNKVK